MTHHTGSDEGRLSEAERRELDAAFMPYFRADSRSGRYAIAAIERILAARAAAPDALRERVEALAAEHPQCWVTRSDVACTDFIGGSIGNGEFTEAMCCLPCRLRAALADPTDGATT